MNGIDAISPCFPPHAGLSWLLSLATGHEGSATIPHRMLKELSMSQGSPLSGENR
jgi:hypothetical protein